MAPTWVKKAKENEDSSPDPRRFTDQPALKITYTETGELNRLLIVEGEKIPRYEVKRFTRMGFPRSKCHVITLVDHEEIATIDFHSIPSSIEIQFPKRQHEMNLNTWKRIVEASGGLGTLLWKGTGMKAYRRAQWELRDETSLIMVVEIDDRQEHGVIGIWKDGLDTQTEEELVVVGISQIEAYKKMLRDAKKSAAGAAAAAAATACNLD